LKRKVKIKSAKTRTAAACGALEPINLLTKHATNYQIMKKNLLITFILFQFCFSLTSNAQWVAIDSLISYPINISTSGGKIYVCSGTSGVYISSDSGNTFSLSNNGLANLYARFILAKDSLLVLGTNNSIYKSIDYGYSWVLASNGIPLSTSSNVEDIIFKGDSILVSTFSNGIYCSLDYCQSWFSLNNGFPDLNRTCLFVNENRIFAGSGNWGSGIYISDDNGASWVPKNIGVPKQWVDSSKYVDITAFTMINQRIFASTLGGNLLGSDDNGESWNWLGAPNNYIWTIFSYGHTILTGHDGAGVCRSDDLGYVWNYENEGLENLWANYKDVRTFCLFGPYIYIGVGANKIFKRPVSELITGMVKINDITNVLVYPNPITNSSKILIPTSGRGTYSLKIFDELGQCVKNLGGLKCNQLDLQKNEFHNGMYIFKLTGSSNESYHGKFIVN
jgi:photosystem II stability/assembly factor-like uncharacterized protein